MASFELKNDVQGMLRKVHGGMQGRSVAIRLRQVQTTHVGISSIVERCLSGSDEISPISVPIAIGLQSGLGYYPSIIPPAVLFVLSQAAWTRG